MSPLTPNQQQSLASTESYTVKMIHAKTQKTAKDELELHFAIRDDNGDETVIECHDINTRQLFEMTTEGQQWLQAQQKKGQSGQTQPIRRSA